MVINEECKKCQIKRNVDKYPDNVTKEEIKKYQYEVNEIIRNSDGLTTPQIAEKMDNLRRDMFGNLMDYTEIKKHYNQLMLECLPYMKNRVNIAEDHLKMAIQYAMVGNYIDFGALGDVNEDKLLELMERVKTETLDEIEYDFFQQDLRKAEKLAYLTDNCGEIVLDKLLIEQLKESYPKLEITVIVRGGKVLNDATIEDAKMTGITKLVKVIGNGTQVAGTDLQSISKEAMAVIEDADLILSKGQGNFETLNGCQKNIYYLFLCKCEWFVKRFGLKQFEGVFVNDNRLS